MSETRPLQKRVITKSLNAFYYKHLRIVNSILPEHMEMSKKEMEVLSKFIALSGDITTVRFGTTARAMVRESLGLSHSGLTNHLKALVRCRIISSTKKDAVINKHILPTLNRFQAYNFELVYVEDAG